MDYDHAACSASCAHSHPQSTAEDCPLDLTTVKIQDLDEEFRHIFQQQKKIPVVSIADVLENLYYEQICTSQHFCAETSQENTPPSFETSSCYEEQNSLEPLDYCTHEQRRYDEELEHIRTEFWNTGTNTEPILTVDNSTQTNLAETKDESAQTNLEKYTQSEDSLQKSSGKLYCKICERLYATKGSYDRHLRTHMLITSDQQIVSKSKVSFTTEAKFQLYRRKQILRKQRCEPIIIQLPVNYNLQCGYCKQYFATNEEKVDHSEECIIEPFEMTKCPECSIKFYTDGCLNRHVNLVHKKPASTTAYYCIFCNQNFDAALSFQVHLEKHLST